MPCYHLIEIKKSTKAQKKMMATFIECKTGRTKTTHFGARGMSDYTIHKDKARRERYLNRHETSEDWENPTTAGSLSRWILWNKPTLASSIADYKRHFHFTAKKY